jgi:hypothetical protein
LDPVTGDVLYEVVYSRVIDNLVNNSGESVGKQVVIPYPINANDSTEIDVVYPNSLINMRDQVIDVVGQTSNLLPLWMLSKQTDGRVLGFTPAWVIAYVNPGQSGQVAYNIRTELGTSLNLVDFQVDRYELDRALTHNWSPEYDQWEPQPPAETTFDRSPGPQPTNIQYHLYLMAEVYDSLLRWIYTLTAIHKTTTSTWCSQEEILFRRLLQLFLHNQ